MKELAQADSFSAVAEYFAYQKISVGATGLQVFVCFSHSAAAGSSKGNNRLSKEIVAFQEGVDDCGCYIPPNGETDEMGNTTFMLRLHDGMLLICRYRKKDMFSGWLLFLDDRDVIAGKIANGRTSKVISAYMSGIYGPVEEPIASEFAIRMLLLNKLEDQYCFLTERAVAALEFIRSESYDPTI